MQQPVISSEKTSLLPIKKARVLFPGFDINVFIYVQISTVSRSTFLGL